MTQAQERRKYRRIPSRLIAHLKKLSNVEFAFPRQLRTADLCTGGVFLTMAKPFKPGSVVDFDIKLPPEDLLIPAVGVVRWCRETEGSSGIGVEFSCISLGDLSLLKQYLDKQPIPAA